MGTEEPAELAAWYTLITIVTPLLCASWIFFKDSVNDKIFDIEIPNTLEVIEDWKTFFIADIKVIDSNARCDTAFPGSDDLFHYVWLGEKLTYVEDN